MLIKIVIFVKNKNNNNNNMAKEACIFPSNLYEIYEQGSYTHIPKVCDFLFHQLCEATDAGWLKCEIFGNFFSRKYKFTITDSGIEELKNYYTLDSTEFSDIEGKIHKHCDTTFNMRNQSQNTKSNVETKIAKLSKQLEDLKSQVVLNQKWAGDKL